MRLPPGFQFSQGSLQDYVDCPRRFQLRYVQRVTWPALQTEPALENERHLRMGAIFHRLVHQYLAGVPVEHIARTVMDPDLGRWWHSYLEHGPVDLPQERCPELTLSTPLKDHRLAARYDLLAIDAGRRAVIVDWKTSKRRLSRSWLAERLQTRVYLYVLIQAGTHLNAGRPLEPEQVEMHYWFANFPNDPETFRYASGRYEEDEVYLVALIEEIEGRGEEEFPLSEQEENCRFCRYRSLCRRGSEAGEFDAVKDVDGFDLLFDAIDGIEY
jgi:CRISPR/Cas system-associated exonuclease Cas4 (RecB family)